MVNQSLKNKKIIISAGASGIGLATVKVCLARGATVYLCAGKSLTRPPRIKTTECSWILCPIPGIYAVTSKPEVRRTRATLRKAELGFFGVCV